MTYRTHRAARSETVVFVLSGDIDIDHAARLKEFLAGGEAAGTRMINCPKYVRGWIAAERLLREADDKAK